MVTESGLVLGVDVGWAAKKKTMGACALEWSTDMVSVRSIRLGTKDLEGIERLSPEKPIQAIAVDGPIRGRLDEIGIYRDAEMMLTRGFGARIGKPGQASSGNGKKLNAAANSVVSRILSTNRVSSAVHSARIHERAIVEAFPTSFLGVMLQDRAAPAHGARSDAYFLHLLGPNSGSSPAPTSDQLLGLLHRILPGRRLSSTHLGNVRDHEERAAVICALTALCVAARKYVAVGDRVNGYIVLPPRAETGQSGLQPWAWKLLEGNRPANAADAIIAE